MSNPYRHPISTPVPELIGKSSIADSPSPKPQAEAAPGVVEETMAAGRIIDVMMGGKFDWRDLHDSDFLESADWATALEYARAALARQHGAQEQ